MKNPNRFENQMFGTHKKKITFEKHVQRFKRHLSMEYSITKNKNIRILQKKKKRKDNDDD